MSEFKEEQAAARGRFRNVVKASELPARKWESPDGKFGADGFEVAPGIGAKDLGYAVSSLAPGKLNCPFHFHHTEEEMFFVLEGAAMLRQGDKDGEEEIEVTKGDFMAFPANTGIAHQFRNHTDQAFVYLALSNRIESDVCEYPDSNKILVRRSRTMLRREPNLEYFDGECE